MNAMNPKPKRECPIDDCHADVGRDRLMCRKHWMYVPRPLQKRIWLNRGTLPDGFPSRHYAQAAREATHLVNGLLADQPGRARRRV